MSWEPLTCCSMGAATDCATTSALAPGKVVDTVTWGGTTWGYWAIGRPRIESAPIRIMTSAMTVEKTGRSMKKLNTVTFDDSLDSVCGRQHSRQSAQRVYVFGAVGTGPATGGLGAGAVMIGLTWA